MGKFEPELWVWLGVNIIVIGLIIVGIIAIVGWLRKTTQKSNQTDSNVQSPTELSDSNAQSPTEPLPLRLAQRKAAEQGYAKAQSNLGAMYYSGNGVLQDTIAAHMWFNIAAANGNKDAAKNRDIAAGKLSSADIVEAQKRAKRCMSSGYKDCD
jgi:TPR repeat protein